MGNTENIFGRTERTSASFSKYRLRRRSDRLGCAEVRWRSVFHQAQNRVGNIACLRKRYEWPGTTDIPCRCIEKIYRQEKISATAQTNQRCGKVCFCEGM